MEFEEFKREFEKYLAKMNISLLKEQYGQFYAYMELLIEWNEKMNLTAITDPKEIILKHFVDSLTIAKYVKEDKSIIDMGTGAGFPGIPIKIYRKDVKVVLADSLNKRIKFLDEVIDKLKLENVETIHCRAEELGKNKQYREKFDYATSRAVANLSTLSEYLMTFLKLNVKCIFMKTIEVEEELEKAKKAIKTLGGKIEKVDKFEIPESDLGRSIIIVKKEKITPSKFPRKPGTPAKEPL